MKKKRRKFYAQAAKFLKFMQVHNTLCPVQLPKPPASPIDYSMVADGCFMRMKLILAEMSKNENVAVAEAAKKMSQVLERALEDLNLRYVFAEKRPWP